MISRSAKASTVTGDACASVAVSLPGDWHDWDKVARATELATSILILVRTVFMINIFIWCMVSWPNWCSAPCKGNKIKPKIILLFSFAVKFWLIIR